MKTIGLLGGMSWESTAEYYRILNQEAARRCGGLSSARIVLHSVDFAEVEALLSRWRVGSHCRAPGLARARVCAGPERISC